jgi:Ciliary protein causing Leber congenital amaurosis disease
MSKIKQKDSMILGVTDQNKHLVQLNKDKNLEEREKLAERVKDLEQRILDKDGDMKLLARRLQLEAKAYRSNLNIEQQKYRDLISKIELSEYMIRSSDINDKKSPKPPRQIRVKSPTRSITSKSATSLTNGHDKEHQQQQQHQQVPLILPPCEGPESKKPEESIKNNSPRINNHVKLLPDESEVDLTKNRFDKSEKLLKNGNQHSDDEITVTIRNGMQRAKIPLKSTKVPAKLSPLHPKQDAKKSSDDSEFSDEDFQLFSEHNGTKMVTTLSPFMVRDSEKSLGVYMGPFSWKIV